MSNLTMFLLLGIAIGAGILEYLERHYGILTRRQPEWTMGRISSVWDCRVGVTQRPHMVQAIHERSLWEYNSVVLEWQYMRAMRNGIPVTTYALAPKELRE